MSSVLTGGFPSTKSSEAQENKGLRIKRAKGQSAQPSKNSTNPQKSLTTPVPLVTPRKALGDLSNTSAITKSTAKKPRQAASIQKQRVKENKVLKSNRAAPMREREGTTAGVKGFSTEFPLKSQVEDMFPDIELMPHTGNQDTLDPPFIPPPYFKSLSSVLRYNPIPSSLPSFTVADSLSSLSLDPNIRPATSASSTVMTEWTDEQLVSDPPDKLPDIPDFGDL